jgi:lysophospholipase L1-like esterase
MKIGTGKGDIGMRAVVAAMAVLVMAATALGAVETSSGDEALIWIKTKMYERQYRRNMRNSAMLDVVLSRMKPDPGLWKRDSPAHQARLKLYTENLRGAPRGDTIAFGDSLLDLTRKKLQSVPDRLNFSISGSWAHHMARMAADIRPALERAGISISVRYVVVGSLGGNPLLLRQPVDVTITHSLAALDAVRRLYPSARIIVYGIPPTVSTYVNTNAIPFEAALYRWVRADRDAVLLPLQRKFAGWLGLYPKAVMSVDGVHFSSKGALEFDRLIEKGKRALAGSIVD